MKLHTTPLSPLPAPKSGEGNKRRWICCDRCRLDGERLESAQNSRLGRQAELRDCFSFGDSFPFQFNVAVISAS
jgi:hypothetical protein